MRRSSDAKYWFLRCLSCSEALFTTLNRAGGTELVPEEQASHPLAGGLLRRGHACGMLWGSALAAGARARSYCGADPERAGATALHLTQNLVKEFVGLAGASDCREIIGGTLTTARARARYVISGQSSRCTRLAIKWSAKADAILDAATKDFDPAGLKERPANCAQETMKILAPRLGLKDNDAALAAGFAGGLGLSGNACGALAAGIFALGLAYYREREAPRDTARQALLQEFGIGAGMVQAPVHLRRAFAGCYNSELCSEIIGRRFSAIDEHSSFVRSGGCRELINNVGALAAEAIAVGAT